MTVPYVQVQRSVLPGDVFRVTRGDLTVNVVVSDLQRNGFWIRGKAGQMAEDLCRDLGLGYAGYRPGANDVKVPWPKASYAICRSVHDFEIHGLRFERLEEVVQ